MGFGQAITEQEARIAELDETIALRDGEIADLGEALATQKARIAQLDQTIAQRNARIAELGRMLAERDALLARHQQSVGDLLASTSWRITGPLRFASRQISRARRTFRLIPDAIARGGGIVPTAQKLIRVLRQEGLAGLRGRLRFVEAMRRPIHGTNPAIAERDPDEWLVAPHYVDPRLDAQDPKRPDGLSIAVHLHLSRGGRLDEIGGRLARIPGAFDLYVSVPEGSDADDVAAQLKARLPRLDKLVVEPVPDRGRDLAPLIVQFGKRLSRYAIVGHFHTGMLRGEGHAADQGSDALDHLLGTEQSTGGRIGHFFTLLQSRAKVIYPEGRPGFLKDETGWTVNYENARKILEPYPQLSIESLRRVEFPEDSMFWARGEALREFLSLPLSFDSFPEEPLASDGTLLHALQRLILVFARDHDGQFMRLQTGDSIQDYRGYEERQDFSGAIVDDDIKVLAYYLPQFHPTPENDEWHGKGFTEWTKVRAANPLFEGHYQQHIPHPDIGYYLLDTPDTLRRQADLMRTSGVHGLVFYHYWFGGRMILEEPARMLLAAPDIAMPFCFCWANENWTRRWDGNESEILLGQNYSPDDAAGFIRYLIPFFQDPRHIRVDGRPVLFVYRPASIPDIGVYIDIWARECRAAGLPAPYLVAVLTRGAMHPDKFGMDAGVERVLHDWTGRGAPEIKGSLTRYAPINGSVLSYDDVADFYAAQSEAKDFTYFRSLIPTWDNTARYGSEAFVVDGSTPKRFQEWLETAIDYSRQNLPADRRLVLVNAWNEWAEGAHLEPDTRCGYAYLNAVGRALSGAPYSAQLNPMAAQIDGKRLHLAFSRAFRDWLADDEVLAQRFFHMLGRSTVMTRCAVTVDGDWAGRFPLAAATGSRGDAEFVLDFRKLAFFGPDTIERMLQTALEHREAVILPNYHNGDSALVAVTASGAVRLADARRAPLLIYPSDMPEAGFRSFRMRTDAQCFVTQAHTEPTDSLPVVTTIIRIHEGADLELLRNALYCLAAMQNCICEPLIAAQDLSPAQLQRLTALLDDVPWYPGHAPKVEHYRSADGRSDLRSRMLNESLRKVESRYAGFLDYDDLLMPHAYAWLIGRLRTTGKAVAFGRVFSTAYSNASGLRLERSRSYEYGYSYEEFVGHNHAPLHSFLFDMSRIDLANVVYHDDQRYMEDYLMTLQIFTRDNADWNGLSQNFYVGDYIHSVDRSHTLAFASDVERQAMLNNPEYKICEARISEMRARLSPASRP